MTTLAVWFTWFAVELLGGMAWARVIAGRLERGRRA